MSHFEHVNCETHAEHWSEVSGHIDVGTAPAYFLDRFCLMLRKGREQEDFDKMLAYLHLNRNRIVAAFNPPKAIPMVLPQANPLGLPTL